MFSRLLNQVRKLVVPLVALVALVMLPLVQARRQAVRTNIQNTLLGCLPDRPVRWYFIRGRPCKAGELHLTTIAAVDYSRLLLRGSGGQRRSWLRRQSCCSSKRLA